MLSPRGTPTPVAATLLPPPMSLMTPIPVEEIEARVRRSPLYPEYAGRIDRESARELLATRALGAADEGATGPAGTPRTSARRGEPPTASEQLGKALGSPMAWAIGRELVRGLFGVLGVRPGSTRRRIRS